MRRKPLEDLDGQRTSGVEEFSESARDLNGSHTVNASTSRRVTNPLRFLSHAARHVAFVGRRIPQAIAAGGGVGRTSLKVIRLIRREGLRGLRERLAYVVTAGPVDGRVFRTYREWIQRFDTLSEQDRLDMKRRIAGFRKKPLISVVMPVFNPPPKFLAEAIESVRRQIYPRWELCIADDASSDHRIHEAIERYRALDTRIKVVYRKENGHISLASNSALEIANGEYIALLDHDDVLAEHALFWVVDAIDRHSDAGLIYSDEDKIDKSGRRYEPYFKCEFNYELFLAQNMISHLGVYRADILRDIGAFRTGFEGAQDYDLALRFIERLKVAQIIHVPRVLYHWRAIRSSTALATNEKSYASEAGRRSVEEHLQRTGQQAEVVPAPEVPHFNRVVFARPDPQPSVTLIIPTRDRADLLALCIKSVLQRTRYQNYEILVVDNGSREPATLELFNSLPTDRVSILRDDSPFNFSGLNNHGARAARGELLCLLNNDIEVLSPDWLEEMASLAMRPAIGCVGGRLWYPDDRLQHGGVICGIGGIAGHAHKRLRRGQFGYFGRAVLHQALSAVTAACLLVRRSVFKEVGGMDESLAVAFNDVDFCLRVREAGYRNVWTPYAEMRHHESASRGGEDRPEKQARFADEVRLMQQRWGRLLTDDPAYNPSLTLQTEDFSLAWPPRFSA